MNYDYGKISTIYSIAGSLKSGLLTNILINKKSLIYLLLGIKCSMFDIDNPSISFSNSSVELPGENYSKLQTSIMSGIGATIAVTKHLLLDAQYTIDIYNDLNHNGESITPTVPPSPLYYKTKIQPRIGMLRIGLIYRA